MYCCTVALLYIIAVSARRFGGRILERVRKVCGVSAAGRPRQRHFNQCPCPVRAGPPRETLAESEEEMSVSLDGHSAAAGANDLCGAALKSFGRPRGAMTLPRRSAIITIIILCTYLYVQRAGGEDVMRVPIFIRIFFFRVFIPFRPVVVVFSSVGTNCCSATRSFGDSEHPPAVPPPISLTL